MKPDLFLKCFAAEHAQVTENKTIKVKDSLLKLLVLCRYSRYDECLLCTDKLSEED